MSDDVTSQLALLQLCDSLFPSGSFAHSYGLEQLARERLVRTPDDLERFVTSTLRQSLAPSDGVAALAALRAAANGDLDGVVEADRALLRLKTASELRSAALATGRRLIEELTPHHGGGLLDAYAARLRADRGLGLYPIAFAVAGDALGVGPEAAVAALLLVSCTALLQAAMRLLPVSHRDVQAITHRLRPVIAAEAGDIVAASASPLRCFQPLQEIAAMRHATAPARLFAS